MIGELSQCYKSVELNNLSEKIFQKINCTSYLYYFE